MRRATIVILSIISSLFLVSCEEETILSIDSAELSFQEMGGSQTIKVSANKVWEAAASESWFTVSPSSGDGASNGTGTITITCAENLNEEREGKVLLQSEGLQKEIIIRQSAIFVSFNDVNFKSYCLNNYDKNKDGRISRAEALAVERIGNFGSVVIKSLGGIEFFKNITSLDCRNNQISALDVSSNTKMNSLLCDNNKLTSLNVSGCSELTSLDCHLNSLSSIDVTKCPLLWSLSFDDNSITTIDLRNNPELGRMSCNNNLLEALDLSKNTKLTIVGCNSNKFASLDVSNNTMLTTLVCMGNPSLKEIWLKRGQTIKNFSYDEWTTIKYK